MAAGDISIEVLNAKRLARDIRQLGQKIAGRVLTNAVRRGAKELLARAQENAPVDSGALKSNMRIVTKKESPIDVTMNVQVSEPIFYAPMVEYGFKYVVVAPYKKKQADGTSKAKGLMRRVIATGSAPPHPFMRPAFEEGNAKAAQLMADYLQKAILKEWKKLGL